MTKLRRLRILWQVRLDWIDWVGILIFAAAIAGAIALWTRRHP